MIEHLSKDFWKSRYQEDSTGWDLGVVSPPIKAYFDQVENKDLRILIPGCGNGHEAEYLFNSGFKNVEVIDLAEEPLESLKARVSDLKDTQIHLGDFFDHQGEYDIIVEQTMFCAIDPSLRKKYADKVNELLVDGGKLVGLMFNRQFEGGPPYGGDAEEYKTYFQAFPNLAFTECYNSIEPRQGAELFVKIVK